MSESKGLTLRDAILSGKNFKRREWSYWVNNEGVVINSSLWDREALVADDYILEQTDADKIKDMLDKQIRILQYCQEHTSSMWAAYISGIIMDVDFRDVKYSVIKRYIESKESL